MICKIIDDKKSGIKQVGRYIIWEKDGDEVISDIRVHNSKYTVDDVDIAISDMAANNFRCTTSTVSKVYHFVISLAQGETLTADQFDYAEKKFIDAFGLSECQRVSATHSGTDNVHRHVAVATASCEDRKNRRPKFDKVASMRVARELEKEFGLSVDAGTSRNSELYDVYRVELEAAKKLRSEKLGELRAKHGRYTRSLRELYDSQIDELVILPRSRMRRESLNALHHDRGMTHLARRAQQRVERNAVYSAFRPETWGSFLKRKAAEGHPEAIRVLRKRERASQRLDPEEVVRPAKPEAAKDRNYGR